jgi:Fic family protein
VASSKTRIEASDALAPEYTADEEERIAQNLVALQTAVHRGDYRSRRLDLTFVCDLHARLFQGVRDSEGGRHRARGRGSEWLSFGPNRSLHRDEVLTEVERVLDRARQSIASIEDNPDDPQRDRAAVHTAVWAHAELVRIHPFEDGNGRTSRAVMGSILVRLGLRPVSVEECKQSYCDCLNVYFETNDLKPLRDLVARLMYERLPG